MATIKQMIRACEIQLETTVNELDVLIATYLCHGMGQGEIAVTLGIDESDLAELINTNEFQSIRQIIQMDIAASKQDIDGGWDSAERKAVMAINEHIENGIANLDDALKIASISNKAERRGAKRTAAIGGQQGGVLTLSLTQNFIQQIQNGRPVKELPVGSTQIIDGDSIAMRESVFVDQNSANGDTDSSTFNDSNRSGSATKSLESLGRTLRPSVTEINGVLNLDSAIQSQGNKSDALRFIDSVFNTPEFVDVEDSDASYS